MDEGWPASHILCIRKSDPLQKRPAVNLRLANVWWLEKMTQIFLPNGGLMVIYHGRICKKHVKQITNPRFQHPLYFSK